MFPALWGLWLFYWGRGSLETARGLAGDLLALARRVDDRALLLQACHALWATSYSLGELRTAHEYASEGVALYLQEQHFPLAASYGNHDAAVCGRVFDARALALLGDTVAAVRAAEAGIALARHLGHPFTLALALVFGAAVHQVCRNVTGTARYAAEAVVVSREQSFPLVLAWAMTFKGWAATHMGGGAAAHATIDEGLARARATGSDQFRTHLLGLAADARLASGTAHAVGLASVEEALRIAQRTHERFYEAELHRLDGELRLAHQIGEQQAAKAAFRRAIEISRAQGADLFLLRAALSLARVRRGPREFSLRTLVEETSMRVTGDPDLVDLQEAAQMLARSDELP